jgi:hypothetical protein
MKLLHQEHLARALDGAIQTALIMRGQTGIFAGKDTALVGRELAEQRSVFEIQRVHGEIDLGLRTRRPLFGHRPFAATFAIAPLFMCLARHKPLLDFLVQRVTAQERIVFFDLELFRL